MTLFETTCIDIIFFKLENKLQQ